MVHDLQCCAGCGDRVGENRVWQSCGGRWEIERSEEFVCGCGEHFCSIDCLIDHGDEEHTNGDITTWPAGTDSRLFDSGEVERRWREQQANVPEENSTSSNEGSSDAYGECDADLVRTMREVLMSSSDSDSDSESSNDSDSESDDSDDEHDVTCECGNYLGTVCNGAFHELRGAVPSECDQDGVRWCEDCWHPLPVPRQQEENETEPVQHCHCCNSNARGGITNNKGIFCSNECLREWSGCPHICLERSTHVQRRLDFDEVAEQVAENMLSTFA